MFLCDRDLFSRPALSELAEVGHERVADRSLEPVDAEEPVEQRVGIVLVEVLERHADFFGELRRRLDRAVGHVAVVLHPGDVAGRFRG
jgi:hypothetical protein